MSKPTHPLLSSPTRDCILQGIGLLLTARKSSTLSENDFYKVSDVLTTIAQTSSNDDIVPSSITVETSDP